MMVRKQCCECGNVGIPLQQVMIGEHSRWVCQLCYDFNGYENYVRDTR